MSGWKGDQPVLSAGFAGIERSCRATLPSRPEDPQPEVHISVNKFAKYAKAAETLASEPRLEENQIYQQRAVLTSTFTLERDTSCRESVRGMVCDSLESQVV
jgi:hypothetical protein